MAEISIKYMQFYNLSGETLDPFVAVYKLPNGYYQAVLLDENGVIAVLQAKTKDTAVKKVIEKYNEILQK